MTPAELIQGYLENSLTEAEANALHVWLAADPANVDAFTVQTYLHSQLCEVLGERKVREDLMAATLAETGQAASPQPPTANLTPSSPVLGFLGGLNVGGESLGFQVSIWAVMTFLAGMTFTMLGLVVSIVYYSNHRADQQLPAARLARVAACTWLDEKTALVAGDALAAGRKLQLRSGLAELIFQNGAKVILQGPASFEIESIKSGYLHQGSLTATVETASAKGFQIGTLGMKYTDLGTEFGVMVAKDGAQEVHVFRGKVQAETVVGGQGAGGRGEGSGVGGQGANSPRPLAGEGPGVRAVSLTLTANQAIRISSPGKPVERIAADEKQFVRTEQMTAQVAAAEEKASRPASVVWTDIGAAPGVVGMAAVNGKLFACTANNKLQVCDPTAATVAWKEIGSAPGPVVAMGVSEGNLCVSLNVRRGGRFLKRDAVETSADWQDDGHAWCLVGMAGAFGKIYAVVDTKSAGSEAGLVWRDAVGTPEAIAKANAVAAQGCDGLPWNAMDRRPPVGALALTEVGGKFYVATNDFRATKGSDFAPEGHLRIAQRFIAGEDSKQNKSPIVEKSQHIKKEKA